MALGFRVGVPGMRIRVSTRGVRTSVGPRAARIHIGSGRTGISTGVGPFYAYHSIGGGRRRSAGPTAAQLQRAARAAERAEQREQLVRENARLEAFRRSSVTAHTEHFPQARPPQLPSPPPVNAAAAEQAARGFRLTGIGMFDRAARSAAKEQAARDAAAYIADERLRRIRVHRDLTAGVTAW